MALLGKRFLGDLVRATGVVGGLLALLVMINYVQLGRSDTERFVTELVMPFSFFWILLGWLALWRWFRGRSFARLKVDSQEKDGKEGKTSQVDGERSAVVRVSPSKPSGEGKWLALVWCFLTMIGNGWLAGLAVRATEFPSDLNWINGDPFDFVVILGGGVSASNNDTPVLNSDGDRIRPPLVLWGTGKTKTLVVTGSAAVDDRPGGAELTDELFRSFGVPEAAIVQSSGRNTSEEMVGLKALVERWRAEHGGVQPRWALVTSAFHMPRALRLAEGQGLSPVPITTATRIDYEPIRWARVPIPSTYAIDNLARCFKEKLAALVGR